MLVVVESLLPCEADDAWAEVLTSRLFREVTAPIVAIEGVGQPLPKSWSAGETIWCNSYLFGVIPIGTRKLEFERIDHAAREIQSRESDALISRWDHLFRITPVRPGWCLYRDEVEIEAGFWTVPIWLFAQGFYRHRHRRWQVVAKRLARRSRLRG
jgi:hypothetical protein